MEQHCKCCIAQCRKMVVMATLDRYGSWWTTPSAKDRDLGVPFQHLIQDNETSLNDWWFENNFDLVVVPSISHVHRNTSQWMHAIHDFHDPNWNRPYKMERCNHFPRKVPESNLSHIPHLYPPSLHGHFVTKCCKNQVGCHSFLL